MEKVIRNGKVAILVSPGFGAGWSTWDSKHSEELIFHPKLVEAAEKGVTDIGPILEEIFGSENHIYTGGWRDIEVKWLPQGTPFYINEYDGSESIVSGDNLYITA